MNLNYKLIATDMDDTLLNKDQEISIENEESIIDVQKKGVIFVLASGRPSFAMFEYAKKLQMDRFGGYILAFNGGELINFKNNELVFQQGLDKKDIEIIYNISKKLDLTMLLYQDDTVFATSEATEALVEAKLCKMKFQKFEALKELEKFGVTKTAKCMIVGNPELVKNAEKYMKKLYGNDYFIAISKPIFLEIANKNVNKGKTLDRLGKILQIKTEEMIAVGDSGNDRPLLEIVGMPVAVANAPEEIKNLSKFVSTSNDENALKTVIDKFFGS